MSEFLSFKLPEHLAARRTARRREWIAQSIAVAVAVLCFTGAALLVPRMNAIRRERQLVIDPATIKGLPPDLSLLGKLGTFRALAIDWASIRADRLKEEGKTYEALQLHETVCALAPRFPKVWVNASWNMAYNISVMKYTPEERWQWVRNGLLILRDRGIVYNPRAVMLYKELAWIYWHKIGDFLDDEHMNYKRALAVEMERVLGPAPVAITEEDTIAWFRKIVEAPRDMDSLASEDPAVFGLITVLQDVSLSPDMQLLDFVSRHLRPETPPSTEPAEANREDGLFSRRKAALREPKHAEALDRLLSAIRSKILREDHRLDLDWMLKLMVEDFGPLDWRNAASHSLYWASYGDHVCRGQESASRADKINTARLIFFSLQSLIVRGKLALVPDFDDPFESYIELTPDIRYIPFLFQTYLRLGKELSGEDPRFIEGTPGPTYMAGFVSNMRNWIELLYLEGGERNLQLAENYFAWLREHNPHPDGTTQEQYLLTLDEFVMGDLLSQLRTFRAAGAILRSFITRSLKQLSLGRAQESVRSLDLARKCYDFWMADTRVDINDRRKMQPFRIILRDEVESYFQRPEVAPLFKHRLWRELPLEFRQLTFDRLRPYFERLCEIQKPPWAISVAFSEPPDLEEFRKKDLDYRAPARMEGVEQGERHK